MAAVALKHRTSAPVAPKKAKRPVVEYVRDGDQFHLYTLDKKAAAVIKAVFDAKAHCYHVIVRTLPTSPQVVLREHVVKPTTDAFRRDLADLYDRYVQMQEILDTMAEEISEQEAKIITALKKGGLRLKPGLLEDAQAMGGPKTRLHHMQSLHRYVNEEAVRSLLDAYPALKKCFRTVKRKVLDKAVLQSIAGDLPPSAQRQIFEFDVVNSFMEFRLRKPECEHCGGKLTKRGVCRHCGLEGMA